MINSAFLIILGFTILTVASGWFYFQNFQISRPSIGTFNLRDVLMLQIGIILVPYIFVLLPIWVAAGILFLAAMSVYYFTFEPILRKPPAIWLAVFLVLSGGLVISLLFKGERNIYFLCNNFLLWGLIVGISNLWVQSGLKARDEVILGLFLTLYDFLSTSVFSLTGDMFNRLIA